MLDTRAEGENEVVLRGAVFDADARRFASLSLPARMIQHATERPDAAAFHVLRGSDMTIISWADLLRQSLARAGRYAQSGVGRGDTVLICLQHGPSLYPAYLGAMLLGAVPSFLAFPSVKQDPELYWQSHAALFDRVQARAVLTYPGLADELGSVLPPATALLVDEPVAPDAVTSVAELAASVTVPEPGAIALLQHSSGTTGRKKGVQLTYEQLALQTASYSAALGMSAESRIASWMPLYHDGGLITAFVMPVLLGASVVSIDAFEWVARPHLLLELMDSYHCDFTWLPNFAFNHLVRTKQGDETYDLAHVRAFIGTAEPVKPRSFDQFEAMFAPHGVRPDQLQVMYGMAECVLAMSQTPIGAPVRRVWLDERAFKHGRAVLTEAGAGAIPYLSDGRLIAGLEVRVDPAAEQGSGDGAPIGELQLRGDFLFAGYDRNPDATAAAFDDGWYRTGDLAFITGDEVVVVGRLKDVIIYHGVNYYAHDLETAAGAVAGIKAGRLVTVATYDEVAGSERIEIIAERDQSSDSGDEQLRDRVKQAVADEFAVVVAHVHLVEAGWLVKTTSGKISRSENAAKLTRERPRIEQPPTVANDTFKAVVETIASTFDIAAHTIGVHTTAADVQGWDSLGHTVLMIRLQRALGSPVPEHVAARAGTVGELVDLLDAHRAGFERFGL